MLRVNKTNVRLPPLEGSWQVTDHLHQEKEAENKWESVDRHSSGHQKYSQRTASGRGENNRRLSSRLGKTLQRMDDYNNYVKNLQSKSSTEKIIEDKEKAQQNSGLRFTSLHDEQAPLQKDEGPPLRDTFTSRTVPLSAPGQTGLGDLTCQREHGWIGTQSVRTLGTQRHNLHIHKGRTPQTQKETRRTPQPQRPIQNNAPKAAIRNLTEITKKTCRLATIKPNEDSRSGSDDSTTRNKSTKIVRAIARARISAVKQIEAERRRGIVMESIREKARRMGSLKHSERQRGDMDEMMEEMLIMKAKMLKNKERGKTMERIKGLEIEREQIHRKEFSSRSNSLKLPRPPAGTSTPLISDTIPKFVVDQEEKSTDVSVSCLSIDSYGRRRETPGVSPHVSFTDSGQPSNRNLKLDDNRIPKHGSIDRAEATKNNTFAKQRSSSLRSSAGKVINATKLFGQLTPKRLSGESTTASIPSDSSSSDDEEELLFDINDLVANKKIVFRRLSTHE